MTNQDTLIFVAAFTLSILSFYKYMEIKKQLKTMKSLIAKCSNTTCKTLYQHNVYIYEYEFYIDQEKFNVRDEIKFKIPFFNPQINDELKLYVDINNPQNVVTPFKLYASKFYLVIACILLILPFLITF